MKNKRNIIIAIIAAIVVLSSIFLYAGHFLFRGGTGGDGQDNIQPPQSTERTAVSSPVVWKHISEVIDGSKQEINILEADPGDPRVKLMPVLSHDLIYGFEKLSDMAVRKKAYAGINGGFFSEYGQPAGMIVIDGNLIAGSKGLYPVFAVSGGKASLESIKSQYWLDYGSGRLRLDRLNAIAYKGQSAVYTPVYGSTDRLAKPNIAITVRKGIVTDIGSYEGEAGIPKDGMLFVFCTPSKYSPDNLPFKAGDAVKLVHEPVLPADMEAYECGTWIVKDGTVVIGDKDPWTGVLTNHDPRTAIGIKKDGKVVLLTVDGRQPGYSAGMTGRELGACLLGLGVENAAMLDGGASTEMIVEGRLVSRPSFKGRERPLGGGLLVILSQDAPQ